MEEKGIKHDQEKIQLDLLSADWIEGVGKVLTFGARKYASHNWRKGIQRSRLISACLRHIFAYLRGENLDPETGLLHLYHASCCLMFASELHFTKPETDDRYKNTPTEKESCSKKGIKHEFYRTQNTAGNLITICQKCGIDYESSYKTAACLGADS